MRIRDSETAGLLNVVILTIQKSSVIDVCTESPLGVREKGQIQLLFFFAEIVSTDNDSPRREA